MKRIGILTFHRAENYGAFWQAYALQETLNKTGDVKAYIFDYRSKVLENRNRIPLFPWQERFGVKKSAQELLAIFSSLKRKRSFSSARKRRYRIRSKSVSAASLAEAAKDYSGFIVGSDQVWNREIIKNDNAYFLDFVKAPAKKFSYAASIGSSELPEKELGDIAEQITGFTSVSIREPDLIPALSEKCGRSIECSIDPVFLLSGDEWRKLIPASRIKKKYVLFFMMGMGKAALPAMSFAKELARKEGLELIYLTDKERWYKFRDMKHYGTAKPEEFIGLIGNAEYVVTNSFHGTAFSILMHTPFFVETSVKRPERITNLLDTFGLGSCALLNGKRVSEGEPDWEYAEKKISDVRGAALSYLKGVTGAL